MMVNALQGVSIVSEGRTFELRYFNRLLFQHSRQNPALFMGKGHEDIKMYRGNFDMNDYVSERLPLYPETIEQDENKILIQWHLHPNDDHILVTTEVKEDNGCLHLNFEQLDDWYNRCWIRIPSTAEEKVYGCGEQLTYFNLKGKNFPLWTSEPGVGRNKETYTTFQADVKDKAGGDYYNTNYPQPTFISTEKYFCHSDTTAYADFNFKNNDFHELHFWEVPNSITFSVADTFKDLQGQLTRLLGRQPELPEWTYNGVWLGIQGGTEVVEQKLDEADEIGLKVGAVWLQDWQGRRTTSFGQRLQWNWQWDAHQYPELDTKIKAWNHRNIKFMGYINPYLVDDGMLFKEAQALNLLAKNEYGADYLVDFGEFYCGVVDFTNPEAVTWYKQVIKDYLIDLGMSGWMADFGEYLPTDVVLHDGSSPLKRHNEWPKLWAEINREAVAESDRTEDIIFFMRAGYTGIQANCPLLWAGDQSVNWSIDDGLASVIPAALSAGVSGMGLHHSDIGGYTSLHGNKRSKELLMRWTELAAFTPVMRTHEGNRPDDCFQYDSDRETFTHLKKMTDIYTSLSPYIRKCVKENSETGLPVQRPLFYEYENDTHSYDVQYQYMLGADLLVAPVYEKDVSIWTVYLPDDEWIHLWSGQKFYGGLINIDAPLGRPPVFYKAHSADAGLFEKVGALNGFQS